MRSTNASKTDIINNLVENVIFINFPSDTISTIFEENIVDESMVLKQSICDESSLKMGGGIASQFEIQIMDTEDRVFDNSIIGKFISVHITQYYSLGDEDFYPSDSLYPSNELFSGENVSNVDWIVFRGYIDSLTRDKENPHVFKLVANDPMSKLYEKDISSAVRKKIKNNNATVLTLLPLCISSDDYYSTEFLPTSAISNYHLDNKEFIKNKDKLSKGELLKNICEIMGGYIFYRPQETRYRLMGKAVNNYIHGTEVYEFYESLAMEEKRAKDIKGLLFNYAGELADYQANDSTTHSAYFGLYAANSNSTETDEQIVEVDEDFNDSYYSYYDLTNNSLVWDYSNTNSSAIDNLGAIKNIYRKLKPAFATESNYIPLTATLDCRLWVEVGDTIQIKMPSTNVYGEYLDSNGDVVDDISDAEIKTITSRVFSRKITGIKALTDEIEAKGEI